MNDSMFCILQYSKKDYLTFSFLKHIGMATRLPKIRRQNARAVSTSLLQRPGDEFFNNILQAAFCVKVFLHSFPVLKVCFLHFLAEGSWHRLNM